jgi:SAM-dependent methyltransferase
MTFSDDEKSIVSRSADQMYAAGQEIWPPYDRWHLHARNRIEQFILRFRALTLDRCQAILDVGCGRDGYAWTPQDAINLDKFYEQVAQKSRAVVGDLENLPFATASFDLVLCVGSVINYVSAMEAVAELARVTANRGRLFLHFETSTSFEQIGKSSWNALATINRTENSYRTDHVWIYSPQFILKALSDSGFKILAQDRFHILSALLSRCGMEQDRASRAARLDKFFFWLSAFADNIIVLAERT